MKTLYKSFKKGLETDHNFKFKKNKWYHQDGEIKCCCNGFHGSVMAIDAMHFVDCEVMALVEVKGEHEEEKDKECWSDMRVIKTYEWTKKDSVKLAIYAAELVIENFEKKYPDDKRPREAIEASKKWLKYPTEKNRAAAYAAASAAYAAYAAASYAAYAACAAAAYAAYAASSASSAAAYAAYAASSAAAAAYAAYAAAAAAAAEILDKCEKFIHKLIKGKLK